MRRTPSDWQGELGRWRKPFLDRLDHKARRRMCPLYVAGQIGPGERKSIQPMAERFAPGNYDQLHHFVAAGVWDAAPLQTELLVQADHLVGGSDAVLVIDDTAVPKKGKHSVGVAAQYASALGKTANCQTLVSLTLARGEVPVMLALRLFLPDSWTGDRVRLKRAGVPVECRTARTKPEIALAEIDRVMAAGVRFGCVLADAGYGLSAPFRQGLTARNLAWAVGHPSSPQGVSCRRAADLARCQARPPATAACPRYSIDTGRRHAGRCQVANCELANRDERQAQGSLCRCPRPHSRRTTAANQGQGSATSAGRRSLAYRRTPRLRREEILPRQSACRDQPAHLGRNHQGAMDL
jgi:DDE superfamily endonuclease